MCGIRLIVIHHDSLSFCFVPRYLSWDKINSLIMAHTVPISKLGTTFAPSLKCLNPNRSSYAVQLKIDVEEEENRQSVATWSERSTAADSTLDDLSVIAPGWRGGGGGGGGGGRMD